MGHWQRLREHIWHDENGHEVLKHTKWLTPDGTTTFPWRYRFVGDNGRRFWFKKQRGESWEDVGIVHPLIYPRDLFAQTSGAVDVLICEGEDDVDCGREAGLHTFTAGHAGAFGRDHAELFRGWRGRITIVRDRDLPGAAGAMKAYDALVAAGVAERRMRICRGRSVGEGGDLRDHLELHGTAKNLAVERVESLRKYIEREAATHRGDPASARTGGSRDLVRDDDDFLVNPHTGFIVSGPRQIAVQLAGWPNRGGR